MAITAEYPAPGTVDFSGAIDGGGYKKRMDDPAKLQPSMIPPVFIEGVSQVLMFGARKYARGNWMRGMSYTDVLDAIKTHTLAIERGEDLDTDSGLPHIYHIGCGLAFLSWYQYGPRAGEYAKFDDRLFKATGADMGKGSGIRQNRDDRAFKASPAVPESPVFRKAHIDRRQWSSVCCGAGPRGEVKETAVPGAFFDFYYMGRCSVCGEEVGFYEENR